MMGSGSPKSVLVILFSATEYEEEHHGRVGNIISFLDNDSVVD